MKNKRRQEEKKTYRMKTWLKIGKYNICIVSDKEYKVKGLKTGFIYNFTCKNVNITIQEMENNTYFAPFP